ncbi:MAG: AtpZ/AtpI family protein [Candidatus Gottesmanbacteria bacterium]
MGKKYEVSLFEDHLVASDNPLKKRKRFKQKGSLFYIGYVGQIGLVIALPIAGGAGIGSYLDTKWGTYPKMTMSGLLIGIVISVINFIAVIKEIIANSKKY